MSREAWLVLDLGFGDAGKGSVVDFLVRDRGAHLVVRHHGGAQAGHNVITPGGRHHTFSQFGAGTFVPGTRTLLGPEFLLHPLAMVYEDHHLRSVGVTDAWSRTAVDRRARLITPYQQAAGRLRELARGESAHGTCGVGIGECVADSLFHPDDTLRAGDLGDEQTLRSRLAQQRERKREELAGLGDLDLSLFDDDGLIDRVAHAWREVAAQLTRLPPEQVQRAIQGTERVVFEGAQGVLLDETWGFHPHTTWSDCTPRSARHLLDDRPLTTLGLLRGFGVRHGAGPFPTEGTVTVDEPHNTAEGWQGSFRTGALDAVLLRYALQVCGGVDGLALTWLDHGEEGLVCDRYRAEGEPSLVRRDEAGLVCDLVPGPPDDLHHREALGGLLREADPVLQTRELQPFLEEVTSVPVRLVSHGPRASDKRWRR